MSFGGSRIHEFAIAPRPDERCVDWRRARLRIDALGRMADARVIVWSVAHLHPLVFRHDNSFS
ncbi:hypothetical protein WT31_04315 [Burkholderia territorii]|nr:hypothetical protein WT31_04315 [Burkholderia territorii]